MPIPSLAYFLPPEEKTGPGFIRILGEISLWGRSLGPQSHERAAESIHEARLLIKRARALLWFARPALGSTAYARARTQLRKAAGLLAGPRDLTVTMAVLEKLAQKAWKPRDRSAVAEISQRLAAPSGAGRTPEKALRPTLKKAMSILGRAAHEAKRIARRRAVWPSRAGRLEKAFRATRKTGAKARRTGTDADFHEWRKKAKRLFYVLELTRPGPERRMRHIRRDVEKLQEKLGSHHDAAIVGERIRRAPHLSIAARRLLRLLAKRKSHLRKKACKIAGRAKPLS